MVDTTTPILGLVKPEVGASDDTWGIKLNGNFDKLDEFAGDTSASAHVGDNPPVGATEGELWWETDSGMLYILYNDGNTTQWVIAAPPGMQGPPGAPSAIDVPFTPAGNIAATNTQAAIAELDAEKVKISGDTMVGHLALPTGPAASNAVRKDYVDAAVTLKADKTYVDTQNALKADKTYVDTQDALKANKTYVDSQDALKADKTYVDTQNTSDRAYTDTRDALKVTKAGDEMTGGLTVISPLDDGFFIAKAPGKFAVFEGAVGQATDYSDYKARWSIVVASSEAETGSNAGSNFSINRSNDAGTFLGSPVSILRSTGEVFLSEQPVVLSSPTSAATKRYVDSLVSTTRVLNILTGTTYTLALTDAAKVLWMDNAAAITLTVPLNSAVAFPVGTQIELVQSNAGAISVTPSGATVIVSEGGKRKTFAPYAGATLLKVAVDTWWLGGNITT